MSEVPSVYEDFEDEITDYAQSEGLPIDTDLIKEIASDYANKTVEAALEEGVTFNKDDLRYELAEYAATYDYYTEAEDKYETSVE